MPPRFAYWTILIDGKATAFRARDREELQPTVAQLKRRNADVTVKWFAQGRLWDSQEAQRGAGRPPKYPGENRKQDWRPGGEHRDPRARFDKEAQRRKRREERADRAVAIERSESLRRDRDKLGPPRGDRPWQTKPTGPRAQRQPWQHKASGGSPRPPSQRFDGADRDRPGAGKPPTDRPWAKPSRDGQRPWSKPSGDRPWSNKPQSDRPWTNKPPGDRPRGAPAWPSRPTGPAAERPPWTPKPHGAGGSSNDDRWRRRKDKPDR